jgi:Flp pilus assembly protein TadD
VPATGVARAELLLEAGRYADAVSGLRKEIARTPDDAEVWRLLAAAHHGLGEHGDALAAAGQAVTLDPDDEWGHRLCSVSLLGLGHHVEAVRVAREAVRLAPETWEAHVTLVEALVGQAREELATPTQNGLCTKLIDEGRAAAAEAVRLAPDEAHPHFAVGYADQARGRFRSAGRAYRRALAIDPEFEPALNNLGGIESLWLDFPGASRKLRASLRLDPGNPEALENLGRLAARALWVCALLLGALDLALFGLSLVVPWPARAAVALAGLAAIAALGHRLVVAVTPRLVPHLVRQLRHRPSVWVTGPLTAFALATAVALLVLPDERARSVAQSYGDAAGVLLRVAWWGLVLVSLASRRLRRK